MSTFPTIEELRRIAEENNILKRWESTHKLVQDTILSAALDGRYWAEIEIPYGLYHKIQDAMPGFKFQFIFDNLQSRQIRTAETIKGIVAWQW